MTMKRSTWLLTAGTLVMGAYSVGACEVTLTGSHLREDAIAHCKMACAAMVASESCQTYYQGGNLPATADGCDAVCSEQDADVALACVSKWHELEECKAAVTTAEYEAACAAEIDGSDSGLDGLCGTENQKFIDCNEDIIIDDDDGGYGGNGWGGNGSTAIAVGTGSGSGGAGGNNGWGGDGGR